MGAPLSEASLSETFGVSKTPVREALFVLKQEGLIEIIPQKGSFVFNVTEESIDKLCDYRSFLEPVALAQSMAKNHDDLVEDLEVCLTRMERKLKNKDLKGFLLLDSDFHLAFFKHCDNPYLQKSYDLVHYHIGAIRSHLTTVESASGNILQDHRNIVDAVSDGDVAKAQSIIVEHALGIKNLFKDCIES